MNGGSAMRIDSDADPVAAAVKKMAIFFLDAALAIKPNRRTRENAPAWSSCPWATPQPAC
jgi:hypothetical protein